MEILITYPHGLGDCLMLTPALREWFLTYKTKVNVAIMKRFESSQIFSNNPYVKNVYYVSDPWNDFTNASVGFQQVEQQGVKIAKEKNIPNTYFLNQPPPTHKILKNAELLNLKLSSYDMEIHSTDDDITKAEELIKEFVGDNIFGFIQTKTGAGAKKDLPDGFGESWLRKNNGLNHFIEIGKAFKYDDYNINIQFEILRKASGVCIPESVFYCACGAMNKYIDLSFHGRGVATYSRIKNMNNNENAVFVLPKI